MNYELYRQLYIKDHYPILIELITFISNFTFI